MYIWVLKCDNLVKIKVAKIHNLLKNSHKLVWKSDKPV